MGSNVTNIIGGAYQAWELDESMHITHACRIVRWELAEESMHIHVE